MARKKKPVVSNTNLLEVAQGVAPLSDIVEKKYWEDTFEKRKDFLQYRREARRVIYKIIKYQKLKKEITEPSWIEMMSILKDQLIANRGLRWDNFAQVWDLHPNNVKEIVLKEHWVKEGGGFDLELGSHYPTAFTNQEK